MLSLFLFANSDRDRRSPSIAQNEEIIIGLSLFVLWQRGKEGQESRVFLSLELDIIIIRKIAGIVV